MNIYQYLEKFDKFTKDPTLEVMEYFMNKLNVPLDKIKFIHIAGTNGKGSVTEMLTNILIKSRYKVGKYMSPHLIKLNERISINNQQITDDQIEEILKDLSIFIDEYNKKHEIKVKWFEVITSVALIYFAKQNCDFVILETGLGGLTDCTNIVKPIISVITSIGLDHMDILGNDILKIAKHKAGIIKQGSDTVFFEKQDILEYISNYCKEKNNKLHLVRKSDIHNYSYNYEYQTFTYKEFKDIKINLKGKKQIYNASLCLECINILLDKGYIIDEDAVIRGLQTVIHKGRFEIINQKPRIIFDGAHNQDSINNLIETINQYYPNEKRIYIISILKSKDYKTVLKSILNDRNALFFLTSGNDINRYVCKEELYKTSIEYMPNNKIFKNTLNDSIDIAIKKYNNYTIFIIGSFYVYKTVTDKINSKG